MMRIVLSGILAVVLCMCALGQTPGTTQYPASLDTSVSLPSFVDNKFTYLTAALTNSATSMTVASTSGFPPSGPIWIDEEQIAYTGSTSTTLTGLTRAFGGTTAAAHLINSTVRFALSAAHVNGHSGAVIALETKLGTGASTPASGQCLTGTGTGTSAWGSCGAVSSVFGRAGAVVAASNDYTWAQIDKTTSSIADITTRSASDLSSGTLGAARMPALTGDVTSSAGTVATTLASVKQARVINNANISVSSGVLTVLSFNTEISNVGAIHSTGTNPSRLTAPSAGLYIVGGTLAYDANATGLRAARILLNGATAIGNSLYAANTTGDVTIVNVSTARFLSANDYVELQADQTSGGSLNVDYFNEQSPVFWMIRIGN
jgi:hypothetical protein